MSEWTAERLAQVAHISDDEVRKDIVDTEDEIEQLQAQHRLLTARINEREAFCAKLRSLLEARATVNA